MNLSLKLNYHLGTTFALVGAALIWFLGIGERSLSASFALLVTLCRVAHLERQDRFHHHGHLVLINRAFSYGKWALGIFFLLVVCELFCAISASNGASGILVSSAMLFIICLKVICGGLTTKFIPGLIIYSLH